MNKKTEDKARVKRLRQDHDAPPPETVEQYQEMKRDLEVVYWRPGRRG